MPSAVRQTRVPTSTTRPGATTLRAAAFFALLAIASPAQQAATEDPGREIFLKLCATCHGETGDGQGVTKLDRPARSFKDGGFSFGDTPEALFRTITSGIPGSPMAAFGEALTEAQRRAVAAHVRSLGPPRQEVSEAETIMVVGDEPVIARGILPPIVDGAPLVPRGLLVGQPDGLTFQYDIDDVRLLGVRMGPFVRRTDWSGRGGTPLEPLGRVVWTDAGGDPPQRWLVPQSEPTAELAPFVARLRATSHGEVWYTLQPDASSQDVTLVVSESGRAIAIGEAVGFMRTIRAQLTPGNDGMAAVLQVDDVPHVARIAVVPAPQSSARIDLGDGRTHWWISQAPDGTAVMSGVRLETLPLRDASVTAIAADTGPGLRVELGFDNGTQGRANATLDVFTLLAPSWNDDLGARLAAADAEQR